MTRSCILLLLSSLALANASDFALTIRDAHPAIASASPFRVTLGATEALKGPQGPSILHVHLRQGDHVLTNTSIGLHRLSQLARGVMVHLTPPDELTTTDITCTAVLQAGNKTWKAEITRPSWPGLIDALAKSGQALDSSGSKAPLPNLWLEQGLLAMRQRASLETMRVLLRTTSLLQRWQAGQRDWPANPSQRHDGAYRCSIDSSYQPYRLSLPPERPLATILLLTDRTKVIDKNQWGTLPKSWLQHAHAHGLAILEWYPAGDQHWDGIAIQRIHTQLDKILHAHQLQDKPVVLFGIGAGAGGCLRLRQARPFLYQAMYFHRGQLQQTRQRDSLGLDVEAARWLLGRRAVDQRIAQLIPCAVAHDGHMDSAVRSVAMAVERAGHRWQELSGGPETATPWTWLLAQIQLTKVASHPRSCVLFEPGELGPLTVHRLTDWTRPGHIRLKQIDGTWHVDCTGIKQLSWRTKPIPPLLVNGESYVAPRLDVKKQAKLSGRANGPLDGYAGGPFVVIIGTGDTAAAAKRNQATAQQFLDAWVAHADGAPPWRLDHQCTLSDWADHHLICIGNSKSNRILAELNKAGFRPPMQTDHRATHLAWPSKDDENPEPDTQTILRAEDAGIALTWPRPDRHDRLVVILDGPPTWHQDDGLPLNGLPDLIVIPGSDSRLPIRGHIFNSDWR